MGLTDKEKTAIWLYNEGLPPSCSTLIDEVTMTYGYGNLDSVGGWEYEIPHSYLNKGESKTVSELMKKASCKS